APSNESPSSNDAKTVEYGTNDFQVRYGAQTLLPTKGHLRFGKSSASPVIPIHINGKLDELAAYLMEHPNLDVEITGGYGEAETNVAGYLNLGLARADAIKQELVKRGIEASRFIQLPKVVNLEEAFGAGDTMIGGIDFRLLDGAMADATNEGDGENEEGDGSEGESEPLPTFEPEVLRFGFNSSDLVLSAAQRDYITRTIQFLRKNTSQSLLLTGHTDGSGQADANQVLGLQRANTVKEYFVAFGLPADRIQTQSRGESNPLATNDTEEGRQENRRVEVDVR
ncbi:MAG: OmpA family protein, partial [Bacteroidota bacterium]